MTDLTKCMVQAQVKQCLNNKQKTDILIFYHHTNQQYCYANIKEWTEEMKDFRKHRKEGTLVLREENNRHKTILGKDVYFLVVQNPDPEKNPPFDPLGMACDDGFYVVSGMIYAFFHMENRDKCYKYIMGIK